MNKRDLNLICFLLILLIISSSVLACKITNNRYDKEVYVEVYEEFEEIKFEEAERKIEDKNVIAIIKIPKINLEYPVIYETTDSFMKIAPTKYAGGLPNEVGNFCIIGHNYYDNTHFSNLDKLQKDDSVYLMDIFGKEMEYKVSDKYEINETDFSFMEQENEESIELTLITCTINKSKRLIIKCVAENNFKNEARY